MPELPEPKDGVDIKGRILRRPRALQQWAVGILLADLIARRIVLTVNNDVFVSIANEEKNE